MSKSIFLNLVMFSIVILISNAAFAQTYHSAKYERNTRPTNNLSFNLFGEASLISVNYENMFHVRPKFFLAGQIGLGYNEEYNLFGNGSPPERYFTIPHHITFNLGKNKHFFECGITGAVVTGSTNNNYLLGPLIGYRLQPLKTNKVNLRIFGCLPFIGFNTDIVYIPFGISSGISF